MGISGFKSMRNFDKIILNLFNVPFFKKITKIKQTLNMLEPFWQKII